MNWWLILSLLFVFLIFLIIITKVTITVTFLHVGHDDRLTINVKIWFGLLHFTYNVPLDKANEEREKKKEMEKSAKPKSFQSMLKNIGDLYMIIKQFLAHITIHKFVWKTEFGTGDAALTGTLTGLIWALKGYVVAFASNYMRLIEKPELNVIPSFQTSMTKTHFECIFSFRIGHALVAGIKMAKLWIVSKRTSTNNHKFPQKAEL